MVMVVSLLSFTAVWMAFQTILALDDKKIFSYMLIPKLLDIQENFSLQGTITQMGDSVDGQRSPYVANEALPVP